MNKPAPVVILSFLALLNGAAALALGVVTLFGNKFVFIRSGYGPDRIAISELFGPFAGYTGWILFVIGLLFMLAGYGLFTLQKWARLAVVGAFGILAAATLLAVSWGAITGEWGVVIGGLFKIAVEIALCWYLMTSNIRRAFSGNHM